MCVFDCSWCDYTRMTRHLRCVELLRFTGFLNSLWSLDFSVINMSCGTDLSRCILIVLNGHKLDCCTVSLAVIVFVVLLGMFTSLSVTVSRAARCGGGGGGGGGDGESSLLLVSTPSISCDDCSLSLKFVG